MVYKSQGAHKRAPFTRVGQLLYQELLELQITSTACRCKPLQICRLYEAG